MMFVSSRSPPAAHHYVNDSTTAAPLYSIVRHQVQPASVLPVATPTDELAMSTHRLEEGTLSLHHTRDHHLVSGNMDIKGKHELNTLNKTKCSMSLLLPAEQFYTEDDDYEDFSASVNDNNCPSGSIGQYTSTVPPLKEWRFIFAQSLC